jgi:hypothetical protein
VPVAPELNYKAKDGREHRCVEEEITNSKYALRAQASEEMKKDGLGEVRIFFSRSGDALATYAVRAIFGDGQKLQMVVQALCEKHGEPAILGGAGLRQTWAELTNEFLEHVRFWYRNLFLAVGERSLIYYEPNIAQEIISRHRQALKRAAEAENASGDQFKQRAKEKF